MECHSSDSKKLFKVFDASKRKRTRKKEGVDDTNSLATDDSISVCQDNIRQKSSSAKASLQDVPTAQTISVPKELHNVRRDRDSSPSMTRSPDARHRKLRSPVDGHRPSRSPRRHRRPTRDGISLALKAGLVSTPRSISPLQEADIGLESIPKDQDSFIYAFLEEAIKRDKRKQRHCRRHYDEYQMSRDRDPSSARRHRHHHRHREDAPSRDYDKSSKIVSAAPAIDQVALFETFAKICAQLNDKTTHCAPQVPHTQSHKSLQCEVVSRRNSCDVNQQPIRLRSHEHSRENVSKMRSQENFRGRVHSHDKIPTNQLHRSEKQEKCACASHYDKDPHFASKLDLNASRIHNVVDDRYREYPSNAAPTRNGINHSYRPPPIEHRSYRDYERDTMASRHCYDDKRRSFEQKTSRSFDVHKEVYPDDDKYCRRTTRSDANKEKRYDDQKDRRYDERDKYFNDRHLERDRFHMSSKDKRSRRHMERLERNSFASREDDYRDRDRYSEHGRDSGLSVADGETSTISGRSNYLRVVKQEISEQREAMDKMMKLWKELMRCFKGISSQMQGPDKAVQDSPANVRESAAAQLRLWRECMRRYETVARDVGDTDARLMEEINKQRSEMAEMASMWQECLQRYREMSTDFNSLKQQLVTPESPTRMPGPPLVCAEGEGTVPPGPYCLPPGYPPIGPMPVYGNGGSPLRPRASAPPAWWWCGERARLSPRRRSSPESRGSRDRDRERRHRHKDRDRDDSRYKEKSSKPNAARSEHRHRKR
ncbi:uncharacterized protein LOC113520229 isoform X2 [Galleria mellonella]|uniref:Uncharacterized protein LOC113520229 isoform X2 n=1 Tax=Galleria mellonella TaxID=7137 RepID=A0A6J3CCT5_GALME|nr:uncharacterized protein LOC113520229 isoform X2 [Galleria mellonella]